MNKLAVRGAKSAPCRPYNKNPAALSTPGVCQHRAHTIRRRCGSALAPDMQDSGGKGSDCHPSLSKLWYSKLYES